MFTAADAYDRSIGRYARELAPRFVPQPTSSTGPAGSDATPVSATKRGASSRA